MFSTKDIIINNGFIDGDFFESLGNDRVKYFKADTIDYFLSNNDLSNISFDSIITHNSDLNISNDMIDKAFKNGSRIRKWYAQNINTEHNSLICLPIGLERTRWFPEINKQHKLYNKIALSYNKPSNKKCYLNFSLDTNSSKRCECYNKINKDLCTVNILNKVAQTEDLYMRYLDGILDHTFVVCPEGNGIDTHRMWECLYLGRIPVVKRNHVVESFKSLPILIIDNWEEVTELLLNDYIENFNINNYSLNELKQTYWEAVIHGK